MKPLPSRLALASALPVVAMVLVGCGIDEDVVARQAAEAEAEAPVETTTTAPDEDEDEEPAPEPSSAFDLGAVMDLPGGYEVRIEGMGETEPGDDDPPVTVLAPDGEPAGSGVVFVETSDDERELPDSRWSSVVVDGIRVWGLDADDADLEEVAASAEAVGPDRAPVVDDPPGGLEVVGSIDADGVVALRAGVPSGANADSPVPGPTSAHTVVWEACEDTSGADACSSLVVMTLPEGTLDPVAVVAEAREPRRRVDEARDAVAQGVGVRQGGSDATGVVTTTADAETGRVVRRELAVGTSWGDVLVIISRGAEILDADALVSLAESASQE